MDKHNFVTIADLSKEKIMYLLSMAKEFEQHPNRELLKGKVVATLFFEPSTRTQLSFQTAANRLGAHATQLPDGSEPIRRTCHWLLRRQDFQHH